MATAIDRDRLVDPEIEAVVTAVHRARSIHILQQLDGIAVLRGGDHFGKSALLNHRTTTHDLRVVIAGDGVHTLRVRRIDWRIAVRAVGLRDDSRKTAARHIEECVAVRAVAHV